MEILSFFSANNETLNLFSEFIYSYPKVKLSGKDNDTAYFTRNKNHNEIYFHFIPDEIEEEFSYNYTEEEQALISSHFGNKKFFLFDISFRNELFLSEMLIDFKCYLINQDRMEQDILISHPHKGIIKFDINHAIIETIAFPIICYKATDPFIYAFRDLKQFSIADKQLVENGIFNGTFIVTSNGKTYKIAEVINKGWATPFWGYSLFIKGIQIKVDFRIVFESDITLDELKQFTSERVKNNSEIWNNLGILADEICILIDNAETYDSVIKIFY